MFKPTEAPINRILTTLVGFNVVLAFIVLVLVRGTRSAAQNSPNTPSTQLCSGVVCRWLALFQICTW